MHLFPAVCSTGVKQQKLAGPPTRFDRGLAAQHPMSSPRRRPGSSYGISVWSRCEDWIPAFAGMTLRVSSVRLFPVVGGAGIDLQWDGELDRRFRRLGHHPADHLDCGIDLILLHLEDQLIVHL